MNEVIFHLLAASAILGCVLGCGIAAMFGVLVIGALATIEFWAPIIFR